MTARLSAALLAGASLFAAALAAGITPAAAIEPAAAVEALGKALTAGSNLSATYQSAEQEGADIVVRGFKLAGTPNSAEADESVTFDTVTITAPADSSSGIFESPTITFAGGVIAGSSNGSIATATANGVTVIDPKDVKGGGPGSAMLYKTGEASDIRLNKAGAAGGITIARITAETGNVLDNVPQDTSVEVTELVVPPELLPPGADPRQIGYDELTLDIALDSTRDIVAGLMTVNDLAITLRDGGTLDISGTVGNLPDPRVLNDPNAKQAASKAEVHELHIRYDEDGFAGRLLDFVASKQGATREAYAQQLSAALPFMLSVLQNAAFQSQVSTAIGAFLQDPQSLTIDIAPDSPVSLDQVIGLARGGKTGEIPDLLKASVAANTPGEDDGDSSLSPDEDEGTEQ